MEFKVGDTVEAWGIRGKITNILPGILSSYPILVKLDSVSHLEEFTRDGKHYNWHQVPTLKLIERPKKKVKKIYWMGATKCDGKDFLITSCLYPSEMVLKDSTTGFKFKIKVELEMDEE